MKKEDWIRKLTSRKLWLAICNFVTMLMLYLGHTSTQAERLTALIMAGASVVAYVVAEGLVDVKGAEGDTVYVTTDYDLEAEDEEEEA